MTFRNAFRLREEIFSCMGVLISCAIYGASMEHLCMGRIVYMCVCVGGVVIATLDATSYICNNLRFKRGNRICKQN